jgi:hypothetical protein
MDWVVLHNYDSQSEARVVESFLRAQGFEVQLLDTYSQTFLPSMALGPGTGMRLLVRKQDEAKARESLMLAASSSHLNLVQDADPDSFVSSPPKVGTRFAERAVILLLALLALLVYLSGRMF